MTISPEECQTIAQVAPVFLLVFVVDRRDIVSRGTGRPAFWRAWLIFYMILLSVAEIGAVNHSASGADGVAAWVIDGGFLFGAGGAAGMAIVLVWNTKPGQDSP